MPTGVANLDAGGLVGSVPYVVKSGENFFTIAKDCYGSGRFYPALWKANSDQVPCGKKLRVGQTIRIPLPEALDRSQILPPDDPFSVWVRSRPPRSALLAAARHPRPVVGGRAGTAGRRPV